MCVQVHKNHIPTWSDYLAMTVRRSQSHLPTQPLTIWDAFAFLSVISLHWVFISAAAHAAPRRWDSVGGKLTQLSGQRFDNPL